MKSEGQGRRGSRLVRLQRQFAAWRSSRASRSRTPAKLWEAAVELARVHGAYAIARELRVNYCRLKKSAARSSGEKEVGPQFVDVPIPGPMAPGLEGIIELETRGVRLRIQLRGEESSRHIASLAEALLRP